MASECSAINQRRFDPTMSRRTRKPKPTPFASSSPDRRDVPQKMGDDGFYHASLKELMKESNEEGKSGGGGDDDGRDKLIETTGTAATEGKSLALVTKQGEGADQGLKMSRMVSRCVKVLNHLVKARHDSKKRSVVRLLM